ncbi:MAG: IS5/IS1182 family transposase, partial [Holophagales bacterium]|nr:IS5/IS1182 family transposase [Holophagales bacterium]
MAEAYRRHDISDGTWELLRTHLKGRKGTWGGNARD